MFIQLQQLVATTSTEAGPRPPDTASAAEARPEPLLASTRIVASVHHHVGLRLVDPARPRDLHPRFFRGRGDLISWPLVAGSEAVSLLLNGIHDPLIAVVEGVDRVVITPQGIPILVSSGDTEARVEQPETSQIAGEQKILEESSDLAEARPDRVLEPGFAPVGGVILLVATAG